MASSFGIALTSENLLIVPHTSSKADHFPTTQACSHHVTDIDRSRLHYDNQLQYLLLLIRCGNSLAIIKTTTFKGSLGSAKLQSKERITAHVNHMITKAI